MLSETSSVMFRGWDPALQGQLAYFFFFSFFLNIFPKILLLNGHFIYW